MTGTDLETATGVTPMVAVRGVHKFFGDLHVLRGIDLDIAAGEVCVILGPSGSGKSTLLRCINELESIDAGRVWVDGELMGMREAPQPDGTVRLHALSDKARAAQRAKIGMVFQRFNLFPHMTALENVMEAPVQVKKVPKAKARERGVELLERVGLGDRLDHYPSQLSGGQQQRVAIARALALSPRYLLLDEPVSGLDPALRRQTLDLLASIEADAETGRSADAEFSTKAGARPAPADLCPRPAPPLLLVSHYLAAVARVCRLALVMDEVAIVEDAPMHHILTRPSHPATRTLRDAVPTLPTATTG